MIHLRTLLLLGLCSLLLLACGPLAAQQERSAANAPLPEAPASGEPAPEAPASEAPAMEAPEASEPALSDAMPSEDQNANTAAIAIDPTASGGLGLAQPDWEAQHGEPIEATGGYFIYHGNLFTLTYYEGHADRVEHALGEQGISVDDAALASKSLMPEDSAYVESYTTADGRRVDLYQSDWLAQRFPATLRTGYEEDSFWMGGEPGNFVVTYRTVEDRVTAIVLSAGNNP